MRSDEIERNRNNEIYERVWNSRQRHEGKKEMNFTETHDSYKKLRQKSFLYNYDIVHTV